MNDHKRPQSDLVLVGAQKERGITRSKLTGAIGVEDLISIRAELASVNTKIQRNEENLAFINASAHGTEVLREQLRIIIDRLNSPVARVMDESEQIFKLILENDTANLELCKGKFSFEAIKFVYDAFNFSDNNIYYGFVSVHQGNHTKNWQNYVPIKVHSENNKFSPKLARSWAEFLKNLLDYKSQQQSSNPEPKDPEYLQLKEQASRLEREIQSSENKATLGKALLVSETRVLDAELKEQTRIKQEAYDKQSRFLNYITDPIGIALGSLGIIVGSISSIRVGIGMAIAGMAVSLLSRFSRPKVKNPEMNQDDKINLIEKNLKQELDELTDHKIDLLKWENVFSQAQKEQEDNR